MEGKKVNGDIFYHISTNNSGFKIGDVIQSGNKINPFFKQFYHQDVALVNESSYLQQCINYYWHFARETIFEDVRKRFFENLPSRKKCLFLCNEENISYWLKAKSGYPNTKILKLMTHGKVHKVDTLFIEQTISKNTNYLPRLSYVQECAIDYWKGYIIYPQKVEYLFYGDAEILDIKLINDIF